MENKVKMADVAHSDYFVAVFTSTPTAKVFHGWSALCDAVVIAFYGDKATPAMRATALKFLTDWEDWVFGADGKPFNKIMMGDNGVNVEVFRLTDGGQDAAENPG